MTCSGLIRALQQREQKRQCKREAERIYAKIEAYESDRQRNVRSRSFSPKPPFALKTARLTRLFLLPILAPIFFLGWIMIQTSEEKIQRTQPKIQPIQTGLLQEEKIVA